MEAVSSLLFCIIGIEDEAGNTVDAGWIITRQGMPLFEGVQDRESEDDLKEGVLDDTGEDFGS